MAIVGLLCYVGLRTARSRPHVAVGIFWYLVTLVPVIGLVQVGLQARADRCTYCRSSDRSSRSPGSARFSLAQTRVAAWRREWSQQRSSLRSASQRVRRWTGGRTKRRCGRGTERDPRQLLRPLLHWPDTPESRSGRYGDAALGARRRACTVVRERPRRGGIGVGPAGAVEAVIDAHQTALRLQPDSTEVRANLGLAYERHGEVAAAIALYREALRRDPRRPTLHISLGHALGSLGDLDGAIAEMREALRQQPDSAAAHAYLAQVLAQKGQPDDAMAELRLALAREPSREDAHALLGRLLLERGQVDDAIVHLGDAVRLQPESPTSRSALGAALVTKAA